MRSVLFYFFFVNSLSCWPRCHPARKARYHRVRVDYACVFNSSAVIKRRRKGEKKKTTAYKFIAVYICVSCLFLARSLFALSLSMGVPASDKMEINEKENYTCFLCYKYTQTRLWEFYARFGNGRIWKTKYK